MTVQDSMNEWGREFLRKKGYEVADDAVITFEEDSYDIGYCETCSYDVYEVDVSDGVAIAAYSGRLTDLLAEMNGGGY